MTFILVLGAIIIASCAVSVYLLLKPSSKANTEKRREKASKPEKAEPVLGSQPLESEELLSSDDPDVVLGLKSAVVAKPVVAAAAPKVNLPEVIVLHLKAKSEQPYIGYELLQALLSAGLRYGKMQIFHRHEKKTGLGETLFSLACLEKPGTFDLAKMGGFSCCGLVLFMQPNKVADPTAVYELMIEVAGQLVEDLGGDVLDNSMNTLTREAVFAVHQTLREAVQASQTADLFV